jgi:hypothetical protein
MHSCPKLHACIHACRVLAVDADDTGHSTHGPGVTQLPRACKQHREDLRPLHCVHIAVARVVVLRRGLQGLGNVFVLFDHSLTRLLVRCFCGEPYRTTHGNDRRNAWIPTHTPLCCSSG